MAAAPTRGDACAYGGHLPRFDRTAGILADDFGLVAQHVRGELTDAVSAARLRRHLSVKFSQQDVNNRLAKVVESADGRLMIDDRMVVPVELFTVVILVAALATYTASPPHGQGSKVDAGACSPRSPPKSTLVGASSAASALHTSRTCF